MPTTLLARLAAILILLLVTPVAAPAAEPARSGHPMFDRTVDLVFDHFHDVSALDRFAAAIRRELQDPQTPIIAESSDVQVDRAIETALASLGASHTGRFRPGTIDYYELADIFRFAIRDDVGRMFPPEGEVSYPGIGMIARSDDGHWFVTDVYDGLPADQAGILVGDEVLSVDDAPYHEIESFRGKVGQTVQLRLRRFAGQRPISAKVRVKLLKPLRMFERAIAKSATMVEQDGWKIGYIRMWTLAARDSMEIVAEALAAGRLKDADGLVLDLRGRWGGGQSDAAELFVGDTPPFRLIPRDGEDILANVRWRRPVVTIIDEGSRSGLEVFAYALKANGISLVGTRTAGALLAGRAYLLPDDSLLELAVSDAVIGDDIRLEGVGVRPDVLVPFDLPYAAGKDPQREAAIEEMIRLLDEPS